MTVCDLLIFVGVWGGVDCYCAVPVQGVTVLPFAAPSWNMRREGIGGGYEYWSVCMRSS